MSITKTGGGTVPVGGPVSFLLKVFNKGPGALGAVRVTDTFPANLTGITVPSAPGWQCFLSGSTLSCISLWTVGPNSWFPAISVQATATGSKCHVAHFTKLVIVFFFK